MVGGYDRGDEEKQDGKTKTTSETDRKRATTTTQKDDYYGAGSISKERTERERVKREDVMLEDSEAGRRQREAGRFAIP